jgi:hypothetical protein
VYDPFGTGYEFASADEEVAQFGAQRHGVARMKTVPQAIAVAGLAAAGSLWQAERFAQMRLGAARYFATL